MDKQEVDQLIKSVIPAIKIGDLETVKNVFEKCRPTNLGFILNEEEELELPGETNLESMLDWSLLNVACAYKQPEIIQYLIDNRSVNVVPQSDFSDPELPIDESPNLVYDEYEMMEYEARPLRLSASRKDWTSLLKLWSVRPAWDTPHFIYLLDYLIKMNETEGMEKLLSETKD